MVSHGNMTAQSRCITEAGGYDAHSVTLSWMPHFHDYGLVKGIIQPAWIGRPAYLMSPLTFLKRPLRWLEAIQRYRVTHSGGPNFAYRHCVETIPPEDRAQAGPLGLGSGELWGRTHCFRHHRSIRRRVRSGGIPARGIFSCLWDGGIYVADFLEATGRAADGAGSGSGGLGTGSGLWCQAWSVAPVRQVVGCGIPVGDTKVIIAHPDTLSHCAAQQIGEIWLAGASTAQGYWNNPEETARTFGARLRDTGEGPFLRTGDLGFMKDGEVFVTGRLKDLLIVRGRNHYPQDIERTVEQTHVLCRAGGAAAFSVPGSR